MTKFFAALCLAFGLMTGSAQAIEIGKIAPDITFKDINGTEHSISGLQGKTVVLEWTNDSCPFVQKFYNGGDMQRLQAEAIAKPNTIWITINSGAEGQQGHIASDDDAKKFVAEKKIASTAYVRDVTGAFGKLYGAKTTPHMFVINPEGKLVYQGAIDSIKSADAEDIAKATNYVTLALEAVANRTLPANTSTEPYGCNVKYAK